MRVAPAGKPPGAPFTLWGMATTYVVEASERGRKRWFGPRAGIGFSTREHANAGAEALHANPVQGFSEACKTTVVVWTGASGFGHTIQALGE